jgi:hypothetical protein
MRINKAPELVIGGYVYAVFFVSAQTLLSTQIFVVRAKRADHVLRM